LANFGRKARPKQFLDACSTIFHVFSKLNTSALFDTAVRAKLAESGIVHLAETAFSIGFYNTKRMLAKKCHRRSKAKKRAKTLRKAGSKRCVFEARRQHPFRSENRRKNNEKAPKIDQDRPFWLARAARSAVSGGSGAPRAARELDRCRLERAGSVEGPIEQAKRFALNFRPRTQ